MFAKVNLIDISVLTIYNSAMDTLPTDIYQTLLQDVVHRDIVTARRKLLTEILWQERYLTRRGLIARVAAKLQPGCFGAAAWEDTFYRDMRVVKQAFLAAGLHLAYSRAKGKPGYYLRGKARMGRALKQIVAGATAEVDRAQIRISAQFSPRTRVQQGLSITELAQKVVAYRQAQREAAHD